MVKAYILIVTDPGRTRQVTHALIEVPHVEAVSEVMGPYDIVAEIMTTSLTEIPSILFDQIRSIDGIQSTTSLVAFPGETPSSD
jgi:DNA-binding Lrp family transcriptional regulator